MNQSSDSESIPTCIEPPYPCLLMHYQTVFQFVRENNIDGKSRLGLMSEPYPTLMVQTEELEGRSGRARRGGALVGSENRGMHESTERASGRVAPASPDEGAMADEDEDESSASEQEEEDEDEEDVGEKYCTQFRQVKEFGWKFVRGDYQGYGVDGLFRTFDGAYLRPGLEKPTGKEVS